MKVTLALLATLAIASPLYAYRLPASGSGALANELQKMMDLIPLNQVITMTRTYAAQDKQFQRVVSVLKSNELKQLVQEVESNPVFQKELNTVNDLGLDMRSLVNDYNKRIGLGPLASFAVSDFALSGGILGYMKDLADLVPIQQMEDLLDSELKTSKVLQEFVNAVASKENVDFYWSIYQNPHYLNLKQQAVEQGISGLLFQNFFPILVFAASIV